MEIEELAKRLGVLEQARNDELAKAEELRIQAFRDKYAPKFNNQVGFADLLYSAMKQQGIDTDAAITDAIYQIADELRMKSNMLLDAVGRTEQEFRQRFAELRDETVNTAQDIDKMQQAVENAMNAAGKAPEKPDAAVDAMAQGQPAPQDIPDSPAFDQLMAQGQQEPPEPPAPTPEQPAPEPPAPAPEQQAEQPAPESPAPQGVLSDENAKNVTRGNIPSSILNACMGVR